MSLEIKNFGFEVKATDDNTFEGYTSVFNNIDSHKDFIHPGAFKKTIQESKRVKVLWQHDPFTPIGKPLAMSEDSKGLHVKAKVSQTEKGKEAMILMKDGVIDELSIGFQTIKDAWDTTKNARGIKEVKLWEFSPVTFASNDQATISGVKSMDLAPNIARLQNWIDDELKAGKVLSDRNKNLVENAIKALTALLDSTQKGDEPPTHGTQNPSKVDEKAANNILGILKEMQDFSKKK